LAGASSAGTVTFASSLLKAVYNPKAFIPHAASLPQACAHWARFPTAASRRSLGRVSVPVWPFTLSGRLPVVALVSRYLTNKLIGRGPIPDRRSFPAPLMRWELISSIRPSFPSLSRSQGQVAHVLLTRSPLGTSRCCHQLALARLACVMHAASVHPEPGSNSPSEISTPSPAARPRARTGSGFVFSMEHHDHEGHGFDHPSRTDRGDGRHGGLTPRAAAGSSVVQMCQEPSVRSVATGEPGAPST
jgi:hypothetical protein